MKYILKFATRFDLSKYTLENIDILSLKHDMIKREFI